jgi:hypothetical protein
MTRTTFMILFIISAGLFLAGGIVFALKVTQKEIDARTRDAGIPGRVAPAAVPGGGEAA